MRPLIVTLALLVPLAAHAAPPTIITSASTFAIAGQPYHYADGDRALASGDAPITWAAPVAPAGFVIDGTTGRVTWTPAAGGDFNVEITATNGSGVATQQFTVHVYAAPTITSTPMTSAMLGKPYQYQFVAVGDPSISYGVATNQAGNPIAPPGLVVDKATGLVTMTPTVVGAFMVTLTATNPYGQRTQTYTLTVTSSSGTRPTLARDANRSAAVGVPYHFNAKRGLTVTAGSAPVTFALVSGPPTMVVDSRRGSVAWIPTAAGPQQVKVAAMNGAGSDEYSFTIDVTSGAPPAPLAVGAATPSSGDLPLEVSFSSSASEPGADATVLSTEWSFGDGSPSSLLPDPMHTYVLAAAYSAKLTVTNSFGVRSIIRLPIQVTASGLTPPSARIQANPVDGDSLLTSAFVCECSGGSRPLHAVLWDFGDGNQSDQRDPTHTFLPGSYRVRLTVVDSAGLSASDDLEVSVGLDGNFPPTVSAAASPPSGMAPLTVTLLASAIDRDGAVSDLSWELGDGTVADGTGPVSRTFAQPGVYHVKVAATDDRGLQGSDEVVITVLDGAVVPPEILSLYDKQAFVGARYRYSKQGRPAARGDQPISWSVVNAPAGLTIDAASGEINWIPTADQVGEVRFTLRASSSTGGAVGDQAMLIHVRPASEAPPSGGCSFAGALPSGALLGALLLLVVLAWPARRRRC